MSVASKIQAVMKAVTSLSKDGRNQQQNYQYLSEEKITTELHKACAEAGLVIRPVHWEILENRVGQTKGGGEMHFCRVIATYALTDADSDDIEAERTVMALGEGCDTGDKVLTKCMTSAYKYALRQTFMISTGDDSDRETTEETTGSKLQPVGKQQTNGNASAANPNGASQAQLSKIHALVGKLFGENKEAYGELMKSALGKTCSHKSLTKQEASKLIEALVAKEAEAEQQAA
jgi:hypothetical protein